MMILVSCSLFTCVASKLKSMVSSGDVIVVPSILFNLIFRDRMSLEHVSFCILCRSLVEKEFH